VKFTLHAGRSRYARLGIREEAPARRRRERAEQKQQAKSVRDAHQI
jgi:hypothetical protein